MNKIWRPLVDRLREFIFCILKAFENFLEGFFLCMECGREPRQAMALPRDGVETAARWPFRF